MFIVDSAGTTAYEGEGRFLNDGVWALRRADGQSAAISKRGPRDWSVGTPDGSWTIGSRFRWFAMEMTIAGGPFTGAVLKGSMFTRSFAIVREGVTLAKIEGNVSFAQDEHRVTMLAEGSAAEWLAVSLAVVLIQQQTGVSVD
jgi:hypothetical protein